MNNSLLTQVVKSATCRFVAAALLTLGTFANAQESRKTFRVGFLAASQQAAVAARLDVFRQTLRDLGHIEGTNLFIETRSADGKFDQLPALAAELVELKVNVILSGGPRNRVRRGRVGRKAQDFDVETAVLARADG